MRRVYTYSVLSCASVVLFADLLNAPLEAKLVLAPFLILIIPLQLGVALLTAGKKSRLLHASCESLNVLLRVLLAWCIGFLAITFLVTFLVLFQIRVLSFVLIGLTLVSIISLPYANLDSEASYIANSDHRWFLVAIILVSLMPFVYVRSQSAFPYFMGFDALSHAGDIIDLLQGRYRYMALSAFPGFDTIVLIPAVLLQVTPFFVFDTASLILFLGFGLGIYAFCFKLLRQHWASVLASVIGVAVVGGGTVADMIDFLPKNVMYALFPLSLCNYTMHPDLKQNWRYFGLFAVPMLLFLTTSTRLLALPIPLQLKLPLGFFFYSMMPVVRAGLPPAYLQSFAGLLLACAVFLLLTRSHRSPALTLWFVITVVNAAIHQDTALVQSIFLLGWIGVNRYSDKSRFRLISAASLSAFTLYFIASKSGVGVITRLVNRFSQQIVLYGTPYGYNFDFPWKLSFIRDSYTDPVLLLFALGLLLLGGCLLIGRGRTAQVACVLPASLGLLLYFLPFTYAYRFMAFLTPFVALLAVYPLAILAGPLGIAIKVFFSTKRSVRIVLPSVRVRNYVASSALLILLFTSLIQPYSGVVDYNRGLYLYEGSLTTFTKLDLEAVQWAYVKYPYETIVVADPVTQGIFSAFGMTYTRDARVYNSSDGTPLIMTAESQLFKDIILFYSESKVDRLLSLYQDSDNHFYQRAFEHTVLIVVNSRTTVYFNSTESYPAYLTTFEFFPGFHTLNSSTSLRLVLNLDWQYFIFECVGNNNQNSCGGTSATVGNDNSCCNVVKLEVGLDARAASTDGSVRPDCGKLRLRPQAVASPEGCQAALCA